jgi:hypothetical protein
MGLLDGIVGNIGAGLGGDQSTQTAGPLGALLNSLGGSQGRGGDMIGAVIGMIQQSGGLPGVLDMFRGGGMAQRRVGRSQLFHSFTSSLVCTWKRRNRP